MLKKNIAVFTSSVFEARNFRSESHREFSSVVAESPEFWRHLDTSQQYQILSHQLPEGKLDEIQTLFRKISNSELEQHYTGQLSGFLRENTVSVAVKAKVLKIFTDNIPQVLQDPELPDSIKHLIINKIPNMSRILERMFLQDPKLILLDSQGQSSFPAYSKACQKLKEGLIKDKDQAGITFSGRSIKLFMWCQEELPETAHPLVGYLLQDRKILENLETVNRDFKTLFNISNLLILQIACGDDIADNIQDAKLTSIFADIPFAAPEKIAEYRTQISEHRRESFVPYFDAAVSIWQDAVKQLETLFGRDYFYENVYPKFQENHRTVMHSLTYSQHMNSRPHDPNITQQSISENLAPNMMVECFRLLEQSLVKKIAQDYQVALPADTEISLVDSIVSQSQKSASAANAAATAPRELKENDFSSPFPFEMNTQYIQKLKAEGKVFIDVFESYIKEEHGYNNHFYATYFETHPDPDKFDYLSLLCLRRSAYEKIVNELDSLKKRGIEVPMSDYNMSSLGVETLKLTQDSSDERVKISSEFLAKLKRHTDLIDSFSEKISLETGVQRQFLTVWEKEMEEMQSRTEGIKDPLFKTLSSDYGASWKVFLCMYAIFRLSFDGTI